MTWEGERGGFYQLSLFDIEKLIKSVGEKRERERRKKKWWVEYLLCKGPVKVLNGFKRGGFDQQIESRFMNTYFNF